MEELSPTLKHIKGFSFINLREENSKFSREKRNSWPTGGGAVAPPKTYQRFSFINLRVVHAKIFAGKTKFLTRRWRNCRPPWNKWKGFLYKFHEVNSKFSREKRHSWPPGGGAVAHPEGADGRGADPSALLLAWWSGRQISGVCRYPGQLFVLFSRAWSVT